MYTNPANDKSITAVTRFIQKDLRVTDNGDGTLTILILATGTRRGRGEDGKAIARNPGQVRFKFLVDHGGTPADPPTTSFSPTSGWSKARPGGATTSAKPRCPRDLMR